MKITPLVVAAGICAGSLLAYAVPDRVRIPRVNENAGPLPQAVFSHRGHNQYQCYACHPSMFPQARLGFTHEQMDAGRYCGQCHNGKTATAVASHACEVCHAP